MLQKILLSADMFGQCVHLTVHKNITSKTVIGGLLTFAMVFVLLALFIDNIVGVLDMKNPTVSFFEYRKSNLSAVINNQTVPFAFEFISLPKYIWLDANLMTKPERYIKPLGIVACNISYITGKDYVPIGDTYCIPDLNETIIGSIDEDLPIFIRISLVFCVDMDPNICASETDRQMGYMEYLPMLKMHVKGINIDPLDLADPVKSAYYSLSLRGKIKESITKRIYMRPTAFETDNGLISSEYHKYNNLTHDVTEELRYQTFFDESSENFEIYMSNRGTKTMRGYMKIQNVIAGIGGLFSVFQTACVIVCKIFSLVSRDEEILNKLMDFDFDDSHSHDSDFAQKNEKYLQSFKGNSIRPDNSNELKIISPSSDNPSKNAFTSIALSPPSVLESPHEGHIFKDEANEPASKAGYNWKIQQLRFSWAEIARMTVCCCRKGMGESLYRKKALYNISKCIVEEFLEISFIIHRLEDIEKLKFALMSDKQLALFKFISKDLCSTIDSRTDANKIHRYKKKFRDDTEMINEAVHYLRYLKENPNQVTDLDNRLLELLNENVKKISELK